MQNIKYFKISNISKSIFLTEKVAVLEGISVMCVCVCVCVSVPIFQFIFLMFNSKVLLTCRNSTSKVFEYFRRMGFFISSASLLLVSKSGVVVTLRTGHCLSYLTILYVGFRQSWPILCHHFNTILPNIGISIGFGFGKALSLLCIYFHLVLALFTFILLQIKFVIIKLVFDHFNGKCPQCWICHIRPQA